MYWHRNIFKPILIGVCVNIIQLKSITHLLNNIIFWNGSKNTVIQIMKIIALKCFWIFDGLSQKYVG